MAKDTSVLDGIHLKVDPDLMDWDLLDEMESGKASTRMMRKLVATFMVDERGQALPYEEAYAQLGKLKVPEINEIGQRLTKEFESFKSDVAVPPR